MKNINFELKFAGNDIKDVTLNCDDNRYDTKTKDVKNCIKFIILFISNTPMWAH